MKNPHDPSKPPRKIPHALLFSSNLDSPKPISNIEKFKNLFPEYRKSTLIHSILEFEGIFRPEMIILLDPEHHAVDWSGMFLNGDGMLGGGIGNGNGNKDSNKKGNGHQNGNEKNDTQDGTSNGSNSNTPQTLIPNNRLKRFGSTPTIWSRCFLRYTSILSSIFSTHHPYFTAILLRFHEWILELAGTYEWEDVLELAMEIHGKRLDNVVTFWDAEGWGVGGKVLGSGRLVEVEVAEMPGSWSGTFARCK